MKKINKTKKLWTVYAFLDWWDLDFIIPPQVLTIPPPVSWVINVRKPVTHWVVRIKKLGGEVLDWTIWRNMTPFSLPANSWATNWFDDELPSSYWRSPTKFRRTRVWKIRFGCLNNWVIYSWVIPGLLPRPFSDQSIPEVLEVGSTMRPIIGTVKLGSTMRPIIGTVK